jgi:D-galactosamine 6-phosphate deaminase/isomerase
MNILGYHKEELINNNSQFTASEISQQPGVWRKIWESVVGQKDSIKDFLATAAANSDAIILTGAGTSAFIGLSLRGVFSKSTQKITEAISTTHLVSHPTDYISKKHTVLLVSFARSGDSPESKAVIELADKYSKECYHLIITCNPEGELAKGHTKNGKFVFLLPEEANDKSLAMTSSYSGMLLAGILIARINEIESLENQVNILVNRGEHLLSQSARFKEIAEKDFTRAVFLGSGPLYGTAKESHLKLQELTDGQVICKHDSYLGFRHGPKAVIDQSTLVFYLFSNKEFVQQYERDLVTSMHQNTKALCEVGVMESPIEGIDLTYMFIMGTGSEPLDEELLAVCSILPAQMLGFHKSIALGLSPDQPSKSGAISRVVEGVHIYDL